MIKDVKTLIAAKRLVHEDEKLMESLKEWHSHKGRVARECADYNFEEWLYYMLEEMSGKIGVNYPDYPTIEQIVGSIRVNSIGDFIAIKASEIAERCGFESDVDCYVEDGVVYSSVWLKSDDAKKTEEYADKLTEKFNNIGYSAETHVDEEDDRESTVEACLDFPLYMKLVDSGMNPECLLCGCGHRKWYNIFP